ncbi:MAG: hypothetical protein HFF81_09355 [Oscillospiraceae bacterium]|jgi:hypothetical protein|nr:hypothetical protein [uncultured Acetatifactor sp.]MCI8680977.1 hypothetical protein [Oscillospiraceae bacterium]MCI8759156.1 hypothetical protein [Oscillospiraceae bacterium]
MNQQLERIAELNRNFNDLGEDLVLLEAVLQASLGETEFPEEYITSSLCRMVEYVDQHTEDICQLARQLANSREQSYCCLTSRPIKA